MALVGLQTDTRNPDYTIDEFTFWIPEMSKFIHTERGMKYFNKLYQIANEKVFFSVFGANWEQAISLYIAHQLALIVKRARNARNAGDTLESLAGDSNPTGVLSGMSVGNFNKQYDFSLTTSDREEALYYNQTAYGQGFYALLKNMSLPSVFVVTQGDPLNPPKRRKGWGLF
jgi:hypothetical protein